jgi:Raf kinase inhibitor-like YbhB/YbcL family protein
MMIKNSIVLGLMMFFVFCQARWAQAGELAGTLKIKSPAFTENGPIPQKYTCQGENCNPPLEIEGIPPETKSLVLIVDDPDAPLGTWVHWVVYNIPVGPSIGEKSVPGKEGLTSVGNQPYHGPCPPSGTHRYFFKLFALNTLLDFKSPPDKAALARAMRRHVLDKAELVGLYKKS